MTFDRIKEIIAEQLEIEEELITEEASLRGELEADSLEAAEILVELESEFGIDIPDEVAAEFETVGDLISFVEEAIEELK